MGVWFRSAPDLMKERLIPAPHLRLAILALTLASGICVAMILGRAAFLGRLELRSGPNAPLLTGQAKIILLVKSLEFRGFIWNLFLAWIPLWFALRTHKL